MVEPIAQLNFRINFELYMKLIEYAEQKNISRTQAVKKAIEKLLKEEKYL